MGLLLHLAGRRFLPQGRRRRKVLRHGLQRRNPEGRHLDQAAVLHAGNTQPGALTAATSVASPFFQTGKTGIILTGPYNLASFDTALGKDTYEVIEAPKGSVDNTVLAEGENIYVTASNGKPDQTKQVINYLVSADGQKAGMTAGKQPIVRVPVNDDVDAAAVYNDPRWGVVQDALKNSSKAFPSAINFVPVKQAVAESLNKIVSDCGGRQHHVRAQGS